MINPSPSPRSGGQFGPKGSYLALLVLTLTAFTASGQGQVGAGSYAFSSGVYPTFSYAFHGADAKTIEGFWRDELKRISGDVSNKKELIASGAVIPRVSPDTVRVLVKAEQRKGSPDVTAHVAFLTREGWLGPAGESKAVEAATAFVHEKSIALRRQLAQEGLEEGEKRLARLRSELSGMQREKERAEQGIEKAEQRAKEAVQEQDELRKQLDALGPRITAQRTKNATSPSEENAEALADLMKQQTRLNDKLRRAQDDERNMKKRSEDLAWDITKNVEDQGLKSGEVEGQEAVVQELRVKLEAIR